MWDGLLDILKGIISPLIEALKELFCWILNFFIQILQTLFLLIAGLFPSWDVPQFLQDGLGSVSYFLNALNWVFPLINLSVIFSLMFSAFVVYYVAVPFYRGIMDLL